MEKVDTSSVAINKKMKSNFSVIFRFDQGRTIFIYRGLKDYSLLNIKNSIKSEWIFLGPIGGHSEKLESDIVARVAESGAKLTWNPGAIQIKNGANKYLALLKNTAVLIMNREEGIKFLNNPVRPNEEEIMRRLSLLGPKLVVITNGKHGAKAFDGKKYYFVPALPNIPRVDSTGAGDSFAVGVLAKLFIEKWNYEENTELIAEALKWGIVNSNSVIQHIGAQKGLLTLMQIERETAKNQRLKVEIQDGKS